MDSSHTFQSTPHKDPKALMNEYFEVLLKHKTDFNSSKSTLNIEFIRIKLGQNTSLTSFVEELSRVSTGECDILRDWAQQFDYMRQMVVISRVFVR